MIPNYKIKYYQISNHINFNFRKERMVLNCTKNFIIADGL
ncbi:hypothetical protein ELI_4234 [Eubacterium callanderi]|uniref:Uncharacterized protein n=1 Tax=Eubacterium callanderi TaxID=53442 RepID=E3GPW3_9FIRM|nr:hypothetical protein ELI_4234 [Eubacterium callanderi]